MASRSAAELTALNMANRVWQAEYGKDLPNSLEDSCKIDMRETHQGFLVHMRDIAIASVHLPRRSQRIYQAKW
ncbi:MAG: hypothetical protein WA947_22770 [Phormidesmis sp.]